MTDKEMNRQIEKGLRAMLMFPETIAEVEMFEKYHKVIGDPAINFPVEEWDSMFEKILAALKPSAANE